MQIVNEAKELAGRAGIRLALTKRCFEVWIALHYELCTRPVMTEDEAIDLVRKYIDDYAVKRKVVPFMEVINRTDQAIANAQALEALCLDDLYCEIYPLVRKLRQNMA
jgi:hypothetical protein